MLVSKNLNIILLSVFLIITCASHSQTYGWDQIIIRFKDTTGINAYQWDQQPGMVNIWKQAIPTKPFLGPPGITDSVMVTLSDYSYPTNNHSSFTVPMNINCDPCVHLLLIGKYWSHTDTLVDYGTISFSPDNGQTWIDLLKDTSTVPLSMWKYNVPSPFRPVLTGSSNGWKYFEGDFVQLLSDYNVEVDDTVLFRFSFHSDANHTGHDGLAFEYLRFDQQYLFTEIEEPEIEQLNIYPNPVNDVLTLENPSTQNSFLIEIFDLNGRNVLRDKLQPGRNKIDVSTYMEGTYVYRLFSSEGTDKRTGKIIISHR